MKTLSIALLATLAATPAFAHPEHIADHGQGHSHWLALAILGGLAASGAGVWLSRRIAVRRTRNAER